MNTVSKTIAALGLVVTAFASTASADYRHIDNLALSIARKSQLIVSETVHYRHTTEYRHMLADAREMCRLANHMHDLVHHQGSLAHLESDLRELDRQFHHLENLFDRVERNAGRGHGHVHGHTAHVKELLCSIEDDIHHLQEDLRGLRTTVRRVTLPAPVVTTRWGGYNVTPQSSGFGRPTRVLTVPAPVNYSGRGHVSRVLDPHNSGYGSRNYRSPSNHGRTISIGGGSSRITFRF